MEARRHLRAEPHTSNLLKPMKMAGKNIQKVRKAAVLSFFWAVVRKLETRVREGNQAGFYKHLKTMNLGGKRDHDSTYISDRNYILLRDAERIRERWVWWFQTLPNAKSTRLDPNIAEGLDQWLGNMPLKVQPTMQDLTNGKAVGTEGVSVELKISPNLPPCDGVCSISSLFAFGGGRRCRSTAVERCYHHGTPQK